MARSILNIKRTFVELNENTKSRPESKWEENKIFHTNEKTNLNTTKLDNWLQFRKSFVYLEVNIEDSNQKDEMIDM